LTCSDQISWKAYPRSDAGRRLRSAWPQRSDRICCDGDGPAHAI
jgi:hypothetical protein